MASSLSAAQPLVESPATLLDVRQIAGLLGCSSRHVQRLADAGRMPRPIHLGTLLRWPKTTIESWVADGCPNCRPAPKARAT
jgi:excisionase family DNA binding protein